MTDLPEGFVAIVKRRNSQPYFRLGKNEDGLVAVHTSTFDILGDRISFAHNGNTLCLFRDTENGTKFTTTGAGSNSVVRRMAKEMGFKIGTRYYLAEKDGMLFTSPDKEN